MEEVNKQSLRAKFQEEIQVRHTPVVLEKPKRLPTSAMSRSGLITMSLGSSVETKTAGQPRVILREDLKTPSGTSLGTTSEVCRSGDAQKRQSLKIRHLPLVLPPSNEPKHDSPSKGITSPFKCIMKPIPTPFSSARASLCAKETGKNGLGLVKNGGSSNVQTDESTVKSAGPDAGGVLETRVSNPGALDRSASPDSLTDSSSGSVTHFFDQHVLSTLEKAKRKLCQRNLLVCGRPKGFYSGKAQAQHTDSPPSPAEETSPLTVNAVSDSTISVMELGGVMQPQRACKPLPDLATLGPTPSKPPRPPHVDLSKYKTGFHVCEPSEALTTESVPEPELVATANASLDDASVPPPEFPDFDVSAPEATDSDAINLEALDFEASGFPEFDSLPPPPVLPDEDDGLLSQSSEEMRNVSNTESVTSDLRSNGSHTTFNLSSEHQLPSEPVSSQQECFHETFDNVYEDVETVPRFLFAQSSYKCKGAPKNPYADNKMCVCFRKKQLSPEHHEDKEQKKKEKQRLEKEKKEQKEKEKKRNEMHKKFKITGLEEPMYHARVLADSKLRKYDLPVKSGDLISIIRTVSCPKGKWLARDTDNRYGYISVMNVELNIKEMLELGKKVSQAAGRRQTDGDNLSISSRSSHQNPVLTSSFTDDSEEWMYEEDTLSLSAENVSQIKAASIPEMFDSNSSAHHPFSDWSIEEIQTQEAEPFQFADIDLLPPPALYADSL
uniref:Si:ch211-188c16.1 n=1 Tax=Cyprinus carpio TaxID=7962 RepID=A0A8C2I189_CYPCA